MRLFDFIFIGLSWADFRWVYCIGAKRTNQEPNWSEIIQPNRHLDLSPMHLISLAEVELVWDKLGWIKVGWVELYCLMGLVWFRLMLELSLGQAIETYCNSYITKHFVTKLIITISFLARLLIWEFIWRPLEFIYSQYLLLIMKVKIVLLIEKDNAATCICFYFWLASEGG